MNNPFTLLDGENYISLRTKRKNGDVVATPVWFVRENEKLYVLTDTDTGKVKRIRHTPEVTLAACSASGEVTGTTMEGYARILSGDEQQHADRVHTQKYGLVKRLFMIYYRIRSKTVAYIEITPRR